ncbi:response regulator transcription factor [Parvularcula sp. ZS-1/3]|uniref:Response regulator transcription factor n=1 Tax=Parvularcula mediterranea TaxID=2732508 RepID=A0A7Y3W5P5_9PROT|nr:response regulator transcription factor [Parvularcula mediterranea]NNU16839.1 response regulator transcription factor [Parvularcula mediterranea]
MGDPRPTVVIVDDHELAREGLRLALDKRGFDVVGAEANGEAGMAAIREKAPDFALFDIRLGEGMDGLTAAGELGGDGLETKIIMLSLHDDPNYVRAALKAGAKGYVLKDASLDELCRDIDTVLAGGTAVPAALLSSALLQVEKQDSDHGIIERLTDREKDVLELIGEGMTNKSIARELDISPATVKAHVERLLAKLGAADRTQAAVMMAHWKQAGS